MTERRFFNCVLTEGILLLLLGLGMLLIPKLTTITFGLMLCLAFIIYGGYRALNAFMTRGFTRHFLFNAFIGLLLMSVGLLLFFKPMFNLIFITSMIGTYFVLSSLATTSFAIQIRRTFNLWWINLFVAFFELFLGMLILVGLPSTALWLIGILAGINFIFAGLSMLSLYISTKYI